MIFYVLPIIWLISLIWLAASLCNVKPEQTALRRIAAGVGWQTIWAFPAMLAQPLWILLGATPYSLRSWPDFLFLLYWPWPVHIGGASVRWIFEATVRGVTGHRESTLFDGLPYFLALTTVQILIVASVFAWRYRAAGSLRNRWLLLIGGLVAVNSLVNVSWPWWGT